MRSLLIGVLLGLAACAAPPPRPTHRVRPESPPPAQTQVYFYPTQGQSQDRQSRDRYECHLWAVKQSNFDPSLPQYASRHVEYVPRPAPGQDTVAGAVTGAVVGAVVAHRGHEGAGAVVGAVAGGIIGAASDSSRQAEADRTQDRYDHRDARLDRQAGDYRRAMTACLQGRGYSVQ